MFLGRTQIKGKEEGSCHSKNKLTRLTVHWHVLEGRKHIYLVSIWL